MNESIRVLHVDDEPGLAKVSAELLEEEDDRFEVLTANTVTEGLELFSENTIDCIVSDYDMPNQNGIDFLERVRKDSEDIPFILFTGKGSEEVASEAFSVGATDYLQKESGTEQYTVLANQIRNAVEKYRSQKQLAERTRRLETLISNLPGMVYRCKNEKEWPLEYVEGEVESLTGYTVSELESDEVVWDTDILYPEDRERMRKAVQEALEERESFEVTYRITTKDGDEKWMWERGQGIYTDGEIEALEGFITDITERVEHEQELEELKTFNEKLVENLPVGLFHIDEELRVNYENPRAEEIVGVPEDQEKSNAIGKKIQEIPSIIEAGETERFEKLAEGERIEFEFPFESIYGKNTYVSGKGVPLFDDGEFDGALVMVEDIAERRERELELERYETIVETSGDPVYTLDDDGYFTFVNDAFTDLSGYEKDELLDQHASTVLDKEDVEKGEKFIESLLSSGDDKGTFEVELNTASGEKIPCENHIGLLPFDEEFQGTVGVLRDITERRKRMQELEEEKERYSTLVEQSHDGVVIVQDKEYKFVNPVMEDLTGLSKEELIGLTFYKIMAPEYQDLVEKRYEKRVRGENPPQNYEIEIVTKEGERRYIDLGVSSIQYQGEPATLATFNDITEWKKREKELAEFQELVEELPVGVYRNTPGPGGEFIEVNHRLIEILGAESREELFEYSPSDFYVKPEQRGEISKQLKENGYVKGFEFKFERLDGEVRWGRSTGIRRERDDGTVVFDGVLQDITEEKERELELKRYETILDTISDGVYALDVEGRYTYVNRYMAEVTGYDREELIGKKALLMMPEETVKEFEKGIYEMLKGDTDTFSTEFVVEPAEGEPYPAEVRSTLLIVDGEFRGTVGVARDVSERKKREEELKRRNERLDEFASIVSHDLRNPLNVAQGRLELAQEVCDSDHLDVVSRSHERMERLIEDLLRLARQGELVSEMEEVNLGDVARSCWQNVGTEKAELVIRTESVIRGYKSRLQQLLENMIRNSVEHGGGDVTITIGNLEEESGFYIEDDGPGIPEEERERVLESGYTTLEDGTGFGLSIANRVAEAHGWDVNVTESEEGGARFEIKGVEVEKVD